ncbi:bifunctional ornithine acetyltransferase/N-acetylglutamate synthase protein [Gloeobacter kilaueensis JS1]|uniref:Arginine biosynthesis bifunctional protein ArgJ n=2 Tax=Gloeobacter TaxID=33071 RepID=U5QK79_GLOK1|nr:bifunctional ornithine acetyltransferase/N-acetylglutamate synthase protein [Gloeobacter kilaueensis JS1]
MISGIKPSGKPDLALVFSEVPATAAGAFTTNLVQAASVIYDRELLKRRESVRAIVVNSGNANAATGEAGYRAVLDTARLLADLLAIEPEEVLVASTGVIGVPLPVEKIQAAAPQLVADAAADGSERAAEAILTTDLVRKQCALSAVIAGKTVHVGGIAKGSGMIHPQMATMLAFITCDCAVAAPLWRQIVRRAVDRSFNQITVDGDTSTNDLLVALANGEAKNSLIDDPHSPQAELLEQMVTAVCIDLAQKVVRDGEGATKVVEVQVKGAADDAAARQIALTVAGSSLVKAAMFGNDPNWGRLAAAAGRAGVRFDPEKLAIRLGTFALMEAGQPLVFDRAAASHYLKSAPTVVVFLQVGEQAGTGTAWGCDLSYDYVKINAEYTT